MREQRRSRVLGQRTPPQIRKGAGWLLARWLKPTSDYGRRFWSSSRFRSSSRVARSSTSMAWSFVRLSCSHNPATSKAEPTIIVFTGCCESLFQGHAARAAPGTRRQDVQSGVGPMERRLTCQFGRAGDWRQLTASSSVRRAWAKAICWLGRRLAARSRCPEHLVPIPKS